VLFLLFFLGVITVVLRCPTVFLCEKARATSEAGVREVVASYVFVVDLLLVSCSRVR
jgi:hypothetical protein